MKARDLRAGLLCICLLLAGVEPKAAQVQRSLPFLTSRKAVYSLTLGEAARGYPVALRTTALYADRRWHLLYFQDQAGAGFVSLPDEAGPIRSGDLLEIKAVTAVQKDSIALDKVSVQVIGRGEIPPAVTGSIESLQKTEFQNVWAQLPGIVVQAEHKDEHLVLELQVTPRHSATVMICDSEKGLTELIDTRIMVTGANSGRPKDDKSTSLHLFVPSLAEIVVHERGPSDPLTLPVLRVAEIKASVQQTNQAAALSHRVHIKGAVEQINPGGWIQIADESGSIRLVPETKTTVAVGEKLNVVGFPRIDAESGPILAHALFQVEADMASRTETEPEPAQAALPVLDRVDGIRRLAPEESSRRYPVEVRGVVTFYDPAWRLLFIQDRTGGVYVDTSDDEYLLSIGQQVIVKGVTDPGGYAPMIVRSEVKALGPGTLPAAQKMSLDALNSGAADSQWIELEGITRSYSIQAGHVVMQVQGLTGKFQVTIPVMPSEPVLNRLIDSAVRLQGVCGTLINAYRQLIGINLHVPSWDYVNFLEMSPADPFVAPQLPIVQLLQFTPQNVSQHRVRVEGTVTMVRSDGTIFIQDATAGMHFEGNGNGQPVLGQTLSVVGFPEPGDFTPVLKQAIYRLLGTNSLPPAIENEAAGLMKGTNSSQRVRVRGRLIEMLKGGQETQLVLEHQETVFHAFVDAKSASAPERLVPGSLLQLEGVCQLHGDEWRNIRSFQILLPGWNYVQLLETPGWWKRILFVIGGMSGVLVIALIWVGSLRRQVQRQTQVIRQHLEQVTLLEERYRELFENASDIIYTVNLEGICTSCNKAGVSTFGCNLDGGPINHREFYRPDSYAQIENALASGAGQPSPELHLESHCSGQGPRLIALKLRPIINENKPVGYQCIGRDITERHQLEQQLIQAQKMESIGQLAAGVAHDYNNLLTVITGNISILLSKTHPEAEEHEGMQEIADAADRAANLTRQLLAFSRRQMLQKKTIDLNKVLSTLSKLLHRLVGEAVNISIRYRTDQAWIQADESMIEQVILNLCVNARDAMPEGGDLKLVVSTLNINDLDLSRRPDVKPGSYVCLSVSDTGQGMDKATMAHIFEPFFTTKEVGKGTGLGLATVFGIVKQHGGWVEVESDEGHGSTFHVYVPEHRTESFPSAESSSATHDLIGEGETILVVEDDQSVRALVCRTLKRAGYIVHHAGSGREALELWNQHQLSIRLLLTDMVLPGGISGKNLAEQLRGLKPDLGIIYCSGYSSDWAGRDFTGAEGMFFLGKPFTSEALLNMVRACLRKTEAGRYP